MKLKPAEYVAHVLGGAPNAARALGLHETQYYRWLWPKSKRGTDGRIPSSFQIKIIELAKRYNLDITCEDIILGREVKEPRVTKKS